MKLLIKYPTRGRPEQFKKAIRNIFDTAKTDFVILVSIDEDDVTMDSGVTNWLDANGYNSRVTVVRGKSISKIDAVNRDMFVAEKYQWDWLVVMSDDMVFMESGWDEKMLQKIQSEWPDSLDWFAHFNDGHVGHRLCTMSIMGREYYERFFYIYAPCYRNIQCDGEAMFVAMMLQRYKYWPDIYYMHQHVCNIGGEPDALYRYNERFGEHDFRIYEKRKSKLFYVNNPAYNPINPDGSWDGEKQGYKF